MNEQQNGELMIRYLQDTCSPGEKERFETWLQESEENRKAFYETRLVWYASRIGHFRSEEQLDRAVGTFNRNVQHSLQQRRKKIYRQVARYAAVFIGILAIAWMFQVLNRSEKKAVIFLTAAVSATDSSKLVELSDGTRVWLNNNSRIIYPQQFPDQDRTVTLEGEAYFDVTHDSAHPFIIQTASIQVKVLGTAFNLQAYPGEAQAEAVLIEGKIAVNDKQGQHLATIMPGQLARFEKSNHQLTVQDVNPETYTSWRYGQITLNGADLETITRKLSELYQVNFSINPSISDTTRYNFIFSKRKSIEEVMKMLRFIAPIQYDIQGKEIRITK